MKKQLFEKCSLYCLVVALLFLLSGCTGSQVMVDQKFTVQTSDQFNLEVANSAAVPAAELEMLEQMLDRGLRDHNLQGDSPTGLLQVTVTKYRFRSDATRILMGNSAGSDAIVSTVTIKRYSNGEILGREEVITHNPTVVSTTDQLIKAHAEKILSSLSK